ncbi:hypothetical protein IIA79_07485, partial [bacterium]|nr:hypothetical protein [bacterium]
MDFRSILIPLALLTLTASVVAKEAASGGEVTKRVYVVTGANASDMPFWIGLGRANEKLEEAITALVEAGELSEDGAAKLREILEKARPRHDKQWRTWRQGKGMGKALSVEVDDEGNVAVEGKGYTDEELDRIREQVEAGIGSDDVVIIDGDDHEIIIDLQDGQAHKYKFMFRDGDGAMRMFEGRGEGWGGWEDWLDPERLKQLGELHPRLSRQRWMRN